VLSHLQDLTDELGIVEEDDTLAEDAPRGDGPVTGGRSGEKRQDLRRSADPKEPVRLEAPRPRRKRFSRHVLGLRSARRLSRRRVPAHGVRDAPWASRRAAGIF